MTLTRLQRLTLWMVAVASLVTAIILLFWAGLPRRADFLGFESDAGYVAPVLGEIAPPIDTETFSGTAFRLEDLRGESVIINFWATWCVPCRAEMPELQALYEETGIVIIAINAGESRTAIASWVDEFGLTFDIIPDPEQSIHRQYRIMGQPTTFIINPDGIITRIFLGATSSDTLLDAIESHQLNG